MIVHIRQGCRLVLHMQEAVLKACALFDRHGYLHIPHGYEKGQEPTSFGVLGLEAHPWWELPKQVASVLRQVNRADLLAEYKALSNAQLPTEIIPTMTGEWNRYGLMEEGEWLKENCALCPRAVAVLKQLPLCECVLGQAYFSVLKGKTRIAEHFGPTNIKLRIHVCLSPSNGCTLRVGEQTKSYEENSIMCFDDSFSHSVYNSDDSERVVLLFDIWHPGLSSESIKRLLFSLQKARMTEFIQKAVATYSPCIKTKSDIKHDNINRLHLLPATMQRLVCAYLTPTALCRLGTTSRLLQSVACGEEVWKSISARDCLEGTKLPLSSSSVASSNSASSCSSSQAFAFSWKSWYRAEIFRSFARIEPLPAHQYDGIIKLLMIGQTGSGKSCFLLRYNDDSFSSSYMSTIGVDFKISSIKSSNGIFKLQIWDVAGPERFRAITTAYYRAAQGIFIMFNVNDRTSFSGAEYWFHETEKHAQPGVKCLLVGLQIDQSNREVSAAEAKTLADSLGMPYVECSAKTGEGVSQAVFTLLRRCTLAPLRTKKPKPVPEPVAKKGSTMQ